MEGLAAISLTANILDFLRVAKDIVTTAKEIHESGATAAIAESEDHANRLHQLAKGITLPNLPFRTRPGNDDQSLQILGEQCNQVSRELLDTFDNIKGKNPHSKREAFYQACKTHVKKGQIESLQGRLDRIGQQIYNHLLPEQISQLEYKLDRTLEKTDASTKKLSTEIESLRAELRCLSETAKKGFAQQAAFVPAHVLVEIAKREVDLSATECFLRQLSFSTMSHRYSSIDDNHIRTLEWIFDTESPASFVTWLRKGTGVYWISGKAGSGKSTAMKFIAEHQNTEKALKEWTSGSKLIMASFYLWNPGKDPLQKSHAGLLRSLLHQVLVQEPRLIPHTFPEIWNDILSKEGQDRAQSINPDWLPVSQLVNAFRLMSSRLPDFNVKLFILIDGLDEYEGHADDMIKLIDTLRSCHSIKVCVSSRPWNEFEKAFGQQLFKVYMQDMTRTDIRRFVKDNLENDEMFRDMTELEGESKSTSFIRELVDAAQGVFLWVHLVVKQIREGLTNADKFSDLLRRLRSLPSDLDEYFERILFRVDDLYSRQAAVMCAVTLSSKALMPLMAYWFIDQEDSDYALNCDIAPIKPRRANLVLQSMKRRLNAYCKGLLEPRQGLHGLPKGPMYEKDFFFEDVDFLHRTVRDFLLAPQTRSRLSARLPEGFNADTTICKANLGLLKVWIYDEKYWTKPLSLVPLFWSTFENFMIQASEFERSNADEWVEYALLNELNNVLLCLPEGINLKIDAPYQPEYSKFEIESHPVFEHCAGYSLWRYIRNKLILGHVTVPDRALLIMAFLDLKVQNGFSEPSITYKETEDLLYQNLNLNTEVADGPSPWRAFLDIAMEQMSSGEKDEIFRSTQRMVENGADPNLVMDGMGQIYFDMLRACFTEEQKETLRKAACSAE